jgi:hypothetical protein
VSEIRADLSQYYPMKGLLEQILGRSSFMRVKDSGPLSSWKSETRKLLCAVRLAIEVTVEVVDEEWRHDVAQLLDHGDSRLAKATSIDELFASLCATLGELAFLQIGFVPRGHYRAKRIPLVARNWRMNPVRSVQYVQSAKQRETQERLTKRRRNGGT